MTVRTLSIAARSNVSSVIVGSSGSINESQVVDTSPSPSV
jgi:hypothetical protein